MSTRVTASRGAISWVNARGGDLYVWIEPFTEGFGRARTSIEQPEDTVFERHDELTEFALHLERGAQFGRTLRIARRWFGLRPGVVANNGNLPTWGGPI